MVGFFSRYLEQCKRVLYIDVEKRGGKTWNVPLRTIAANETYRNTVYNVEAVSFPASLAFPGRLQTVGASCAGGSSELPSPIVSTTSASTFVSAIASSLSAPCVSIRSTITSSGEDEHSDSDGDLFHVFRRDVSKVASAVSVPEDGSWKDAAPMERGDGAAFLDDDGISKHYDVEDVKVRQQDHNETQSAPEEREEASRIGERQSESSRCTSRKAVGNENLNVTRQSRLGQPHEENVNTVTILSSALPHQSEEESSEPGRHAVEASVAPQQQPLQHMHQSQQPKQKMVFLKQQLAQQSHQTQQRDGQHSRRDGCGQMANDDQGVGETFVGAVRQQSTCFTSVMWPPRRNQ